MAGAQSLESSIVPAAGSRAIGQKADWRMRILAVIVRIHRADGQPGNTELCFCYNARNGCGKPHCLLGEKAFRPMKRERALLLHHQASVVG
jgi:hypothetical protein